VSLALKVESVLTYAVIYNPIMNEFYYAEKDFGAYLNDEKIYVSNNSELSHALLGTGFAYNFAHSPDNNFILFREMLSYVHGIRRAGSAALDLAFVAKGVFDGFWEWFLNPWDVCAGILLIKEAGGIVTNIYNKEWDFDDKLIVAGSKNMHGKLLSKIQEIGFNNR
jgi:myo-inositol-1(or 4)-monophosphatase